MRWFQFAALFFLSISSMLLVSCDSKSNKAQDNAKRFVKQLESATTIKEDVKKEESAVKPVVYEGANLRDPFEIPSLVKSTKLYPNAILTNMALDTLTLSGVMLNENQRWAVLRSNDGKLYKISEGMHVGIQQALVKSIEPDKVIFQIDIETDSKGTRKESREIVMTLQEPKELKESKK